MTTVSSPAVASTVIVGGGVFGLSTALYLAEQRHTNPDKAIHKRIVLLDQFQLFDERNNSTDINRIVRSDYRGDVIYTHLAKRSIEKWEQWNRRFAPHRLYEPHGQLALSRDKFDPQSYIYEQFQLLAAEHGIVKLNSTKIGEQIPAWHDRKGRPEIMRNKWTEGYISKEAGWANAKLVMKCIADECIRLGVEVREHQKVVELIYSTSPDETKEVIGVKVMDFEKSNGTTCCHFAERVILCCGAWTGCLMSDTLKLTPSPPLSSHMQCVANIVGFFEVRDLQRDRWLFESENFPNFLADIESTGFYGFPISDDNDFVKIANHGILAPFEGKSEEFLDGVGDARQPDAKSVAVFTKFVKECLPFSDLLKLHHFAVCYYLVTTDHSFLIDAVPSYDGLFVATGGSGHAFKFAPVLGELVMDCVEKKKGAQFGDAIVRERFKWKVRQHGGFFDTDPQKKIDIENEKLKSKL